MKSIYFMIVRRYLILIKVSSALRLRRLDHLLHLVTWAPFAIVGEDGN
jgi:hypothetical protein